MEVITELADDHPLRSKCDKLLQKKMQMWTVNLTTIIEILFLKFQLQPTFTRHYEVNCMYVGTAYLWR